MVLSLIHISFIQKNTIETTGAGDTFCACVLHYVLEHGLTDLTENGLKEMLTFANAAASIITTRKGALLSLIHISLQTDMNLPASEILSTYVYRIGLLNGDYGYSTAVGLFNSVINVILLIFVNFVVKKINDGEGL